MDLFDDIWIQIFDCLHKRKDIYNVSQTHSHWMAIIFSNLHQRCFRIIEFFQDCCSLFFDQGILFLNNISEINQIIHFYFQLKECFKQRNILTKTLISLQLSTHPRLFERTLKLFSNKEYNRFYKQDLLFSNDIIDDLAVLNKKNQITEIFEEHRLLEVSGFENPFHSTHFLLRHMTKYCDPLKQYQNIRNVVPLQKYLQLYGFNSDLIFLRCFLKELTPYQIEKSIDSFEKNDYFQSIIPRHQAEFVSEFLGEVCHSDYKTIVDFVKKYPIIPPGYHICILFPIEHVKYVLDLALPHWAYSLNEHNLYHLLKLDRTSLDALISVYISGSSIKYQNDLVFRNLMNYLRYTNHKWVLQLLTNDDFKKYINDGRSLHPKFYYFLDSHLCKKISNMTLDQNELFKYLFDKDVESITESELQNFSLPW